MPKTSMHKYQHGLALFEIAIVLLIVGLVFGAASWGFALLDTARLRSVVSDTEEYRQAIKQFEEQYNGLPGDLYNASDFWAAATDGDHNRQIDPWNTEGLQAWYHLQLASLVKGNYTGATVNGAAVPGENVPQSKIAGTGFSFYNVAASDPLWDHGDTPGLTTITIKNNSLGNVLIYGYLTSNSYTSSAALTPSDALAIDTKLDDSWPDSGNTQSAVGTSCTAVSGGRLVYDASNDDTEACALAFKIETNN